MIVALTERKAPPKKKNPTPQNKVNHKIREACRQLKTKEPVAIGTSKTHRPGCNCSAQGLGSPYVLQMVENCKIAVSRGWQRLDLSTHIDAVPFIHTTYKNTTVYARLLTAWQLNDKFEMIWQGKMSAFTSKQVMSSWTSSTLCSF